MSRLGLRKMVGKKWLSGSGREAKGLQGSVSVGVARVAQLAEQLICNRQVEGSIPSAGSSGEFVLRKERQRSFNRQSTAFVMRGLRVRLPSLALGRANDGLRRLGHRWQAKPSD